MSGFRLSPEALDDLDRIDDYLAAEAGDEVAELVIARIFEAFDLLSMHPGMGHRREDLTTEAVRCWAVYSYLIVYREGAPIEVVRIWNSRRDPRSLGLK